MKKTIFGLLMCILFLGGVVYILRKPLETSLEYHKIINISSNKVYINTSIWGISSNHYYISLSNKEKGEDIIFYETEIYYKQQGVDSIIIYFPTNSFQNINNRKLGDINIILNGFMYSQFQDYKDKYKEMGLCKISVYDGIE